MSTKICVCVCVCHNIANDIKSASAFHRARATSEPICHRVYKGMIPYQIVGSVKFLVFLNLHKKQTEKSPPDNEREITYTCQSFILYASH